MGVGADVIVGMKLEAIGQLVMLAAEFIADQAAAVETSGGRGGLALIEEEGQQLVRFLEQELLQYVEGQIIDAAVGPLISKVEQAVVRPRLQRAWRRRSASPAAPDQPGAGDVVAQRRFGYVQQLDGHRSRCRPDSFVSSAGSMDFE